MNLEKFAAYLKRYQVQLGCSGFEIIELYNNEQNVKQYRNVIQYCKADIKYLKYSISDDLSFIIIKNSQKLLKDLIEENVELFHNDVVSDDDIRNMLIEYGTAAIEAFKDDLPNYEY